MPPSVSCTRLCKKPSAIWNKGFSLPIVYSKFLSFQIPVSSLVFICRYQREEEERERTALLSRKFTPNEQDTSIEMDHALRHNTQLQNSHRGLDDLLVAGSSVLGSLREQSVTLKGTQKKILDIANMLGLSNTVMRLIEKRTSQDKIILFVGIFVIVLIMYIVIAYLIWPWLSFTLVARRTLFQLQEC